VGASTLIAIDWGTTAARAYRLDADGEVREARSAALGVARIQDGRFADALLTLLGDWHADPAPRLACGMIGSRQGWMEAPYVECPASLASLAGGLANVAGGALAIVPGLCTRDRHGIPDVMRGEETQLVGTVGATEAVLAVLPGTHSKWAHVDGGRVNDFVTYMTGEIYAVLLGHTILGRIGQRETATIMGPAFERGVRRGLAAPALSHAAFGARTLALVGELAPADVDDWLSGTLIGEEIRDALAWARARSLAANRVRVVGHDTLVARYVAALAIAGIETERGARDAAPRGLWRIAAQAGLLR